MTKQQAVAYAQVTLDYMLSSKYEGELNPDTFGKEMKEAFKLYSRNFICDISDTQKFVRKKVEKIKNGSDDDA